MSARWMGPLPRLHVFSDGADDAAQFNFSPIFPKIGGSGGSSAGGRHPTHLGHPVAESHARVRTAFPPLSAIYYCRRIAAIFLIGFPEGVSMAGRCHGFSGPIADFAPFDLIPKDNRLARWRIGPYVCLRNRGYGDPRLLTRVPVDMVRALGDSLALRGLRDERALFRPRNSRR